MSLTKVNKKIVNKIIDKILEYPLLTDCKIDTIIPRVQKDFMNLNADEIEELISDFSSTYNDYFCKRIISIQGKLNHVKLDLAELFIIPSTKSINLAQNAIPEFEKQFLEQIEQKKDFEKGIYFELFVKYLFEKIGLELKTTPSIGDNGLDLIGKWKSNFEFSNSLNVFIQCKYYDSSIDINVVKKVCSDITFNLLSLSDDLQHPVMPILAIKEGVTNKAQIFAEKFGVKIIELRELINKAAEISKLSYSEFEQMIKNKSA